MIDCCSIAAPVSLETTCAPVPHTASGLFSWVRTARCTASRTNWHRDTPRVRATSFARPFVLWDTRPLMTVGWERPFGFGAGVAPCSEPSAAPDAGPFSLDGCELLVSRPSDGCPDVGLLERGCLLVSIMTKAGCKYSYYSYGAMLASGITKRGLPSAS